MLEFFRKLFQADFMSHGHCYYWRPEIVWLHVVSDLLIALAYYFIPFALLYIVRKRKDFAYPWMIVLFGVFILACGTTHLVSIWVVWTPVYRLDGVIKAITAIASVPTAILLMRLAPAVIALPSPEHLRQVNAKLEIEVRERQLAESQVRELNADLERRVHERTQELADANRLLVQSENRLRAILDSSPMPVFIKDPQFRYLFGNTSFEQLSRRKREDFLGKSDFELWPADLAAAYRSADEKVFSTLEPLKVEEIAYQNNEAHTFMSVKFPLLDEDETPYALCGIATDITERMRAENILRQSNLELEQFAYVAAHDLQEPLRTIKSYAQLLLSRYKGSFDADAQEFMGYLTGAVDRMVLLVAGLQSYASLADRADQVREMVDMNAVVQDTLRNLAFLIQESGAEIAVAKLPSLLGNSGQLGQVFQNLVSNAIKYRSDRPLKIEISAVRHFHECEFVVRDNGIGLDMQYADRIFGVFRRLHGHDYPGAGIGLAIVKKVVESHNGRVWVVSQVNVGSEFHFALAC